MNDTPNYPANEIDQILGDTDGAALLSRFNVKAKVIPDSAQPGWPVPASSRHQDNFAQWQEKAGDR